MGSSTRLRTGFFITLALGLWLALASVVSAAPKNQGNSDLNGDGPVDQADLVIFDAMYSLAEAASVKSDWGHSSNVVGVELCQAAAVKRLALFHHEPIHDDKQLSRLLAETRRLEQITRGERAPLEIVSAYDGLIVDL